MPSEVSGVLNRVGKGSGKCRAQTGKIRLTKGEKMPQKPQTPGLFLGGGAKKDNQIKLERNKKNIWDGGTTVVVAATNASVDGKAICRGFFAAR